MQHGFLGQILQISAVSAQLCLRTIIFGIQSLVWGSTDPIEKLLVYVLAGSLC